MLTPHENERLSRIGPGTPMGEVFRRYWQPIALTSELPEADGAPIRRRVLCEDLVAFRDTDGKVGLVDAFCPHRRAPMFFGRNEECGLRCVYHGWKFDRSGTCVDMPSEPADSLFRTKVRIAAYPTWEGGGMIWAYLGPPDSQPPPPDYELTRAPATHRHVSKTFEYCNWLQALEGGLDTSHSSFLHNLNVGDRSYLRNYDTAPRLEVERTPYGFRYAGIRSLGDENYVRVYHYVMPAQQFRGNVTDHRGQGLRDVPTIHGHLWVPIDDTHTWVYNWLYSYDPAIAIDEDWAERFETRAGRGHVNVDEHHQLRASRENDYFVDRSRQRTTTFTGIEGVNTQDFAMQEGMGPIVDRSLEHLGTSDRAIIATRQLLVEAVDAVERGEDPRGRDPHTYGTVRAVDLVLPATHPWQETIGAELTARF